MDSDMLTIQEAKQLIPPGRYRHFKGNEYEVLDIASHSETEEPMVVYRALYGSFGLWVRPAAMWLETVERDGHVFRRFTQIHNPGRYVAFDVETPNSYNDRMSAIGITVIEDGEITDEFFSLVIPETRFDAFNIELTGISPADVENEPTFPQLWKQIEPFFSDGILIAHNAPFDLSVLASCLQAYGIHWRSKVQYACTVRMGRQVHPELPNHRLNTMCEAFGIDLDHHHADSDSRACAELLLRYQKEELDISSFIRTYELNKRRIKR
jgi:DNA polymerase-3 subunit epsilon